MFEQWNELSIYYDVDFDHKRTFNINCRRAEVCEWGGQSVDLELKFSFTKNNDVVVEDIALGTLGLGSIPGPVKMETVLPKARHCCDVQSELYCPDAKLRRWTPPLFTRLGDVILRVMKN